MASDNRISCFAPVADERSRVLVLGTMPSVQSLGQGFYYAHPRNAFWPILCAISGKRAASPEERRALALEMGIAIWDTIGSCEREGSLDSAIRERTPNDISGLLQKHPEIRAIFCNGKTAEKLCRTHCGVISLPIIALPSTSPAYTMPFEQKLALWREAFTEWGIPPKQRTAWPSLSILNKENS